MQQSESITIIRRELIELSGRQRVKLLREVRPQPRHAAGADLISGDWNWRDESGAVLRTEPCPFGRTGDTLFVQEKFSTGANGLFFETDSDGTVHIAWNPAGDMRKDQSRFTIRITRVRVWLSQAGKWYWHIMADDIRRPKKAAPRAAKRARTRRY